MTTTDRRNTNPSGDNELLVPVNQSTATGDNNQSQQFSGDLLGAGGSVQMQFIAIDCSCYS